MKSMKYRSLALAALLTALTAAAWWAFPHINAYQVGGEVTLPGLSSEITVTRDEKGMAYIRAENLSDALKAQGFVTAQDRLFQMQLTRLLAQGRISELVGEAGRELDIRYRTIGLHRIAKRHARMLEPQGKAFFQDYVDGVNAFIERHPADLHVEFTLAGIEPEPWTVVDSLSVLYYMSWSNSANLESEVISQMLVEKLGADRAHEIFPYNFNPDDRVRRERASSNPHRAFSGLGLGRDKMLANLNQLKPHRLGSNNWVVSARLAAGNHPILAGDPHLDTRVLPGVWYPIGIVTPQVRAVGANIAGLPGIAIGRTGHIAIAMTVAYGDMQDLYVETVDPENPGNYLEGGVSKPFSVVTETLRIKDETAPGGVRKEVIRIRSTGRGPVVTGVLEGLETDRVLTLRWAAAETMRPAVGLRDLLLAETVEDVHLFAGRLNMMALNFVFADVQGNIGWRVSGSLPIRAGGDGAVPRAVTDGADDWVGWIPFAEMPHATNPARGWLGTANHQTVGDDYPYYFSSHFAPNYRYRRMSQLLNVPGEKTVDDHWQFQRDTKNQMAQTLAPIMAAALVAHQDTESLGRILADWSFMDDPNSPAPTIFQGVYRKFTELVFSDELGPKLTAAMLGSWYFWQQRLEKMTKEGDAPWFDNINTPGTVETRDALFHQAALAVAEELEKAIGGTPNEWLWGKVHMIEFVNPLRRHGAGKALLGGRVHSMGGSGETLYRGRYDFDSPAQVTHSASLRMVIDLGDPDKVLAVLPGGVAGRTFHPHLNDQVAPFMSGEKPYWWFSDEAIRRHAVDKLVARSVQVPGR